MTPDARPDSSSLKLAGSLGLASLIAIVLGAAFFAPRATIQPVRSGMMEFDEPAESLATPPPR